MSGLAAVLSQADALRSESLQRMLVAAPHRGPTSSIRSMGSCLLAITTGRDSATASLAEEGEWGAAFVGMLDNSAELDKGSDRSPADIVLALFRHGGAQGLALLRGTFAAVITDGRRVWCFRDHLGFEPLFYTERDGTLFVASEAKQVVAGADITREPDVEFLEGIFFGEPTEEGRSAYLGIRRLPRRMLLTCQEGRLELSAYWQPERLLESSPLSPSDLSGRFDELMTRAAARALTGADLVSLSGGIDSAAVAAFAAKPYRVRTGRDLPALAALYPRHTSVDERHYIELIARQLSLELHTYEAAPSGLARLPEWVDTFDGPWDIWAPDQAEEFYLRARTLGGHTILTGEFAELVFDIQRDLLTHLIWRGKLPAVLRQLSEQHRAGIRPRALARQVLFALSPRFVLAAWKRVRPGFSPPHWVDPVRIRAREARRVVRRRERWPGQQLGFLQGPGLSVEADAILQARCGVRVRRPWTDVDLWEFFLSLPAELKFPHAWSKSLVRSLLRGQVPDAVLDRQDKTVFNEFVLADIDYPSLRRWLVEPRHRIQGIEYRALSERLEREDLQLSDYVWAKDLAAIQAFLDRW